MRKFILYGILFVGFVFSFHGALAKEGGEYKRALHEWTRQDEAYSWSNLEARLVWYATYLGPDFRKAKVKKEADFYKLTEKEIELLTRKEDEEGKKYDSFFISIYAGSKRYPDIGKNRNIWRLVLETEDGKVYQPSEWIEVPSNQATRVLYPYIDRWSKTYEVRFPKVTSQLTRQFQLKMVGVPADSVLTWSFKNIRSVMR